MSSASNYPGPLPEQNDVVAVDTHSTEVRCHRCYGSGQDRDGADCIHCEGFGSVISSY